MFAVICGTWNIKMRTKLAIFDVDGLLLNTERIWEQVWHDIALSYDFTTPGELVFRKLIGRSSKDVRNILKESMSDKQINIESLLLAVKKIGIQRIETSLTLQPGATELLSYLKKNNVTLGIATSTEYSLTAERLQKVGIWDLFDYVCCGNQVKNAKPNPDVYLRILQESSISPLNTIAFEDSPVGAHAASEANLHCFIVPDILGKEHFEDNDKYHFLSCLSDACSVLK